MITLDEKLNSSASYSVYFGHAGHDWSIISVHNI